MKNEEEDLAFISYCSVKPNTSIALDMANKISSKPGWTRLRLQWSGSSITNMFCMVNPVNSEYRVAGFSGWLCPKIFRVLTEPHPVTGLLEHAVWRSYWVLDPSHGVPSADHRLKWPIMSSPGNTYPAREIEERRLESPIPLGWLQSGLTAG
jgi:hypothetical protein